jgi:hypothetical protein
LASESNCRLQLTALCRSYETLFQETVNSVSSQSGFKGRRAFSPSKRSPGGDDIIDPRFRSVDVAPDLSAGSIFPLILAFVLLAAVPLPTPAKDKLTYGEGLIVNIPLPQQEVAQVVEDIAQNGVIRGTKEYNKDEFVGGAKAANTPQVFPPWDQGGKVFYKVRTQAIDPRNFKDSGDVGTLVVRYVVQPQGESNTVLRIDALFQEDFRRTVHQSNGSVESAEYKDVREHLDSIEIMKAQTAEAQKERQERLLRKQNLATGTADNNSGSATPPQQPPQSASAMENNSNISSQGVTTPPSEAPASAPAPPGQTLEERVKDLRKQVERIVKAPGAPLKSAPFHTASTLELLTPGTEVLIVISTPYWYGVETRDGQHGWMQRDQLELLQ